MKQPMLCRSKVIYKATQVFEVGDHKKVEAIPDKYKKFIPVVQHDAIGMVHFVDGEYNSNFIFGGDWILEGPDEQISVVSDEDFNECYDLLYSPCSPE